MRKTNLLLLLFLFIAGQLFAGIIYVKPGEESFAWEGKKDVYTSIAEAYAASKNMDEIWVAAGTYQLESTIVLASKTVSFYGIDSGRKGSKAEWQSLGFCKRDYYRAKCIIPFRKTSDRV